MGGTNGCCTDTKLDASLNAQAQSTIRPQSRNSHGADESEAQNRPQSKSRQSQDRPQLIIRPQSKSRQSHDSPVENTKHNKKRKIKNELISPLRECIKEYNHSVEDNVLNMIGDRTPNTMNACADMELLDSNEICRYFKLKKYDIQWFLITPRNKFVITIVNRWPAISIVTSITIYVSLRTKISKKMPSVTNSTLNLLSPLSVYAMNDQKHIRNITFTWKNSIKHINQCNSNEFVYIVSLIVQSENQEILKSNTLFQQSQIGRFKPLYAQKQILCYLVDVEMDGLLFEGITKDVFYKNFVSLVVDEHVQENDGLTEQYIITQYIINLYIKVSEYDVTRICKNQLCTIEFSVKKKKEKKEKKRKKKKKKKKKIIINQKKKKKKKRKKCI
eukprot:372148_1